MALRLIFMGTPEFSVPTLRALVGAGHAVACVYTQPPRPAGRRGLDLTPSPVQREAERLGLAVRSPLSIKPADEHGALLELGADALVVVAYGLLLPKTILDATPLGAWNGHASLLPRWRGAAPINRAIMAGDAITGMMVMRMEEGLDTGPVAMAESLAIGPDMTAGELHDQLMQVGAGLMVEAMARLEAGTLAASPQSAEGVTYAAKIDKVETRIDWRLAAPSVHNRIRGLSPSPGAWCLAEIGGRAERLRLLRSTLVGGRGAPGTVLDDAATIACAEGAVRLLEVQRAGGKPQSAAEFLRGARLQAGAVLS